MFNIKTQNLLDYVLILNLFLFSNASAFFIPIWLSPEFVGFEFVIWSVLAGITLLIMRKENFLPGFMGTLKRNWIVLPFIVFSGLSIFWSVYWEISLLRWLILIFTILTGGYIGLKYDLKAIIKFLAVFGVIVLLFAALLVAFVPSFGVQHYYSIQGAWKGIYWHKNHMGLITAFINILFFINIIYTLQSNENTKNLFLWGGLYLFSLLFMYQTDSVAAYLTTIFLHGVILLALFLLKFGNKLRRIHYLIFFVVLVIAAIILFSNLDVFFGLFNRNTTLTGRIPMWTFVFENYLGRQPLLGYGFNAFWYVESHQVAVQQAAGYPGPIIIADNGFIDILINTGYIGLFLFLIIYLGLWWWSIAYALKAKDIIGVFPVILMSYTFISNISWSLIFENEGFFMLIMIAVLFSLSKSTSAERRD